MERTGYCVKCKANRTIAKAKMTTTKNGRSAVSGVCKTCGTKMMRFVKKGRETLYFRDLIVAVNVEYLVHIYVECTVTDGLAQRNGLSRRPRKGTTPLINTRCSNLVPVIFRAKNRIPVTEGELPRNNSLRSLKSRSAINSKMLCI